MQKFVKMPGVFKAVQWTGNNHQEVKDFLSLYDNTQCTFERLTEKTELVIFESKKINEYKTQTYQNKVLPSFWIVENDIESRIKIKTYKDGAFKFPQLEIMSDYSFRLLFKKYENFMKEYRTKNERN